jgi:hypothetical protein
MYSKIMVRASGFEPSRRGGGFLIVAGALGAAAVV